MSRDESKNPAQLKADAKTAAPSGKGLTARDVTVAERPRRRSFPGPRGAQSPLRVAIDRSAHAELIAHAKVSLEAEICGVLAGDVCEDDEGLFIHVQAAIRGAGAAQGSTHVTFTHATWNAIHTTLERDHPNLRMVGWYHSHPGFGVEFSEMDLFIQRNFFSSPTQIALVTDPLSGAVAICVNTATGIEYLPRFWVDGREQECKAPGSATRLAGEASDAGKSSGDTSRRFGELEARVGQLVLAVDELRGSLHRFLLLGGMLFCLAIIGVVGYVIFQQWKSRIEPPRNIGFASVPVKIGDHTALLGVQIVSWELPPELDVVQQALDQVRAELEKQLAAATNAPNATTNSRPGNPPPTR